MRLTMSRLELTHAGTTWTEPDTVTINDESRVLAAKVQATSSGIETAARSGLLPDCPSLGK